jgi:filamin
VNIGAGTDAAKSIAFGPGLEDKVSDHLPTMFTIQAKDRNGNNMNKGGDPWEVKIQGPDGPVDANVKDNGDGTYTVDYAPKSPGKHRIDVTLKGAPVQKSPFTVNVKEGADEDTSLIDSYSFVIQAKTRKGANKKDGTDDFKVCKIRNVFT